MFGLLLNVPSLCILGCLIAASTYFLYWMHGRSSVIPIWRLLPGYVGALTAVALLFLFPALVQQVLEPGDMSRRAFLQIAVPMAIFSYLTCLGIALIGAPLIFSMAFRGYGSIPRLVVASVVISLFFIIPQLALVTYQPKSDALVILLLGVGLHIAQSLGFGIGLGLPWRWRRDGQLAEAYRKDVVRLRASVSE